MNQPNRRIETFTYIAIWTFVVLVYVIDLMNNRNVLSRSMMDSTIFLRAVGSLGPYILLFIVHNYILIPRFLLGNRYGSYCILTFASIAIVWLIQYYNFTIEHPVYPILMPVDSAPSRNIIPLPLILDFIYALLIVGGNVSITLLFQRYEDRYEKEKLRKENVQNELTYLRSQLNPHFYMNMLNNIHGLIEINPDKAQQLVLDMATLMRYILYDSSKPTISFTEELIFIKKYIDLMRSRYDPNKVKITTEFPDEKTIAGISLPPLLFINFIENAFKHGISYKDESYVTIKFNVREDKILFFCQNLIHNTAPSTQDHPGIGLRNVRQRLSILFKNEAVLEVSNNSNNFNVTLIIPLYAITNLDH